MEEEEGIYRDEVTLMLSLLGDIKVALQILRYIEGEDDEEEEEDDPPDT